MVSCQYVIYIAVNHTEVYQHLKNEDSLCAGQSGAQIQVGAKFSTPVQTNPGSNVATGWQ
jgi:hypothetical protein